MKIGAVLFGLVFLSGCASAAEEHSRLSGASASDLCYAATDDGLDKGTTRAEAIKIVNQRGIKCDWASYTQMHLQQRQAAAAAAGNTGLMMMQLGQPRVAAPMIGGPSMRQTHCTTIGAQINCTTY